MNPRWSKKQDQGGQGWSGTMAVALAMLAAGATAQASPTSLGSFVGAFNWSQDGSITQRTFVVQGRTARILANRTTLARCKQTSHDLDYHGRVAALHYSCESATLAPFKTPVSLLTLRSVPQGRLISRLRFGSWLEGYRSVELRVSVDRLVAPVQKGALAQVAAR